MQTRANHSLKIAKQFIIRVELVGSELKTRDETKMNKNRERERERGVCACVCVCFEREQQYHLFFQRNLSSSFAFHGTKYDQKQKINTKKFVPTCCTRDKFHFLPEIPTCAVTAPATHPSTHRRETHLEAHHTFCSGRRTSICRNARFVHKTQLYRRLRTWRTRMSNAEVIFHICIIVDSFLNLL